MVYYGVMKAFFITVNGHTVEVEKKRIKSLTLRIANGKIKMSIPYFLSEREAYLFAEKKSGWIEKHLNKPVKEPFSYIKGGKALIFGETYGILQSKKSFIDGEKKTVFLKTESEEELKKILKVLFTEKLKVLLDETCKKTGLNYSGFSVKDMKKRYGSCNVKTKKLNFALRLASTNEKYINFVICHELIHTVNAPHDKRFYALLSSICPEHKRLKKELDLIFR